MATRIEDISIFGEYSQAENRVTAGLLQILKVGGEPLIRHISTALGFQLPSSEISISTQIREKGSVPDGLLSSSFAFSLYVESKVERNSLKETQLQQHCRLLDKPETFLVYLTPDDKRPSELPQTVYWANWRKISDCLDQYIQNPKVDNLQLLVFLIGHFQTLLSNMELTGERWNLDNDQVLIVAGSWAEDIALKYQLYICQNRRKFQPSRYIAFFNNNRIEYVFEILAPPQDDCDVTKVPEFRDFADHLNPQDGPRRVFRLRLLDQVGPIINDSVDRNGNPCPFTYGQPRYTTLPQLRAAKLTTDL